MYMHVYILSCSVQQVCPLEVRDGSESEGGGGM